MNKKVLILFLFIFVLLGFIGIAASTEEEMVKCACCCQEMKKADAKISFEYQGKTYYFGCEKCKEFFSQDPEKFLKETYVCPMCTGVTSDTPGKCPKCGMELKKQEPACCPFIQQMKEKKGCPHHSMDKKCCGGCCAKKCPKHTHTSTDK